jgi:hypothetical protein
MRRIIFSLSAIIAMVLPLVVTSLNSTAPSASAAHGVALSGSVVGRVASAESGQPVTFVFTEQNTGSSPQSIDLVVESLSHASVVSIGCVLANGNEINPDGSDCEPGSLSHGQTASIVLGTSVTSNSGPLTTRVCVSNEGTGVSGPCKTLTVHVV